MKVLVCGGAGYIGSHVAWMLPQAGYEVIVYDNFSRGHQAAVAGLRWVEGDIGDEEGLSRLLATEGVEAVLHFAASSLVGESVREPEVYFRNNAERGLRLLAAVKRAGCPYFIFSSTAAVYGEPQETPITESHPRLPTNPYGVTKAFFEDALHWYGQAYGLKSVCLRYFNAAGADPEGRLGEDHQPETHLIPLILQTLTAPGKEAVPLTVFGDDYPTPDGTPVRDYIHVTDLARAHLLALKYLRAGGESDVFNLGNQRGFSVLEVIKTAEAVTGLEVPYRVGPRRAGDPAVLVASAEKARKVLGWEPQYPHLETIITTAWEWQRRHPEGFRTEKK